MKLFYIFLVFISFVPNSLTAQKENPQTKISRIKHHHFAPHEELAAQTFTYSITEQYIDTMQQLHQYTINSPEVYPLRSFTTLKNYVDKTPKATSSLSSNFLDLQRDRTPFLHIEVEARDINFLDQSNKLKLIRLLGNYNLEVKYVMNAHVKISHVMGDKITVVADTSISSTDVQTSQFPKDYKGLSMVKSKDTLQLLWNQHHQRVRQQWRLDLMKELIEDCLDTYRSKCITELESFNYTYGTDRNRKGGFDKIQQTGDLFENTLKQVEEQSKDPNFQNNFWTEQTQKNLGICLNNWLSILETSTSLSDEMRKNMTQSYITALILTGEFDTARKLIEAQTDFKFGQLTRTDKYSLRKMLQRLEEEFQVHNQSKGWIRLRDLPQ